MQLLFWLSLFGATYSYFAYPLVLLAMPGRKVQPRPTPHRWPIVSIIVTAHNEASRIEDKLRNTLDLDYPWEALDLIVASDASSDGTDDIVRRFEDPRVGAISSEDQFVSPSGQIVGEGAYVKYEMWLRRLESSVNSLVGLSGSFFAARRSVCTDWNVRIPSDFNTALNAVRYGYVAVSAPDVVGVYKDIADSRKEYQRKVRTIVRGIAALAARAEVLNPFRFGFFAFQVFSHKLMRWLVPWFLVVLLTTSVALTPTFWFYRVALGAQLVFYGFAAIGALAPTLRAITIVKLPFFFLQVNAAVLHATVAFLLGKRVTVWTPSKR